MKINPIILNTVSKLGTSVELPNEKRNFCLFNTADVNFLVTCGSKAIPVVAGFLNNAKDEKKICEALYVLGRMIDADVKGVKEVYPVISKFNNTNSPNIQVLLAGIYRKTLIPDAFGPLNKMLLKQTFYPNSPYFDPTEEIGGAILEYLRAKGSQKIYTA